MDFDFFDSMTDSDNFDDGSLHTEPNIFGGDDIYDNSHNQIAHTEPNIFGGHDLFNDINSMVAQTTPNIFGGVDVDMLTTFNPSSGIPDFTLDI